MYIVCTAIWMAVTGHTRMHDQQLRKKITDDSANAFCGGTEADESPPQSTMNN